MNEISGDFCNKTQKHTQTDTAVHVVHSTCTHQGTQNAVCLTVTGCCSKRDITKLWLDINFNVKMCLSYPHVELQNSG